MKMTMEMIKKYFLIQAMYDGINVTNKVKFNNYLKKLIDFKKLKKIETEDVLAPVYLGIKENLINKFSTDFKKCYKDVGVCTENKTFKNGTYAIYIKFVFSSGVRTLIQIVNINGESAEILERQNNFDKHIEFLANHFKMTPEKLNKELLNVVANFLIGKDENFWKHFDKLIEEA